MVDFDKLLKQIPKHKLNLVESEILQIIQENLEVKKVGFKAIISGNMIENKGVRILEKEIEDIILSGELEEFCDNLDISIKLKKAIKSDIKPIMKDYEVKQIIKFLKEYLDVLTAHGCNDFNLEEMIENTNERFKFVKEYHEINGDPENIDFDNLKLSDFSVLFLLIKKLEKEFNL